MRVITLIVCFALATPALAAEPWEGVWTDNRVPSGSEGIVDPCNPPKDSDWGTFVFSKGPATWRYRQCDAEKCREVPSEDYIGTIKIERSVDPWICSINKITKIRDMDAWLFDTECGGEGEIWPARTLVMLTKRLDSMAVYSPSDYVKFTGSENQPIAQLYRCPSPLPRPKP